MERDERIYIPPKRSRPYYRERPQLTRRQQLRLITIGLLILSLICGVASLVLK
jgi:hypothetical protein